MASMARTAPRSMASRAPMYSLQHMETDSTARVSSPAKEPGPVTRMNSRPVTMAGRVRRARSSSFHTPARQGPEMFRLPDRAMGTDTTAPMAVPATVMARVSRHR